MVCISSIITCLVSITATVGASFLGIAPFMRIGPESFLGNGIPAAVAGIFGIVSTGFCIYFRIQSNKHNQWQSHQYGKPWRPPYLPTAEPHPRPASVSCRCAAAMAANLWSVRWRRRYNDGYHLVLFICVQSSVVSTDLSIYCIYWWN